MAYTGYHFFIGDLELPYAPSELTVTIDSKNKTVELIDGTEINILKNPKLTEIEFEIELPRGRQYAFANKLQSPIKFTDYFEKLVANKQVTNLVITRNPEISSFGSNLIGNRLANIERGFVNSNWKVTLEGYELKESANNAYDIVVALKFKQYVSYGTVKKVVKNTNQTTGNTTSTTQTVPTNTKPNPETKKHKVKSGDTLYSISRMYYGNSSKWKTIYEANKKVIEETAKKHGKAGNGHWIFPDTELIIPADSK